MKDASFQSAAPHVDSSSQPSAKIRSVTSITSMRWINNSTTAEPKLSSTTSSTKSTYATSMSVTSPKPQASSNRPSSHVKASMASSRKSATKPPSPAHTSNGTASQSPPDPKKKRLRLLHRYQPRSRTP